MIQARKLKTLPRTLALRKAASVFANAERAFVLEGSFSAGDAASLAEIVKFLLDDPVFQGARRSVFENAILLFTNYQTNFTNEKEKNEIRAALNTVHYILITETGVTQSDWDFIDAEGSLDISKRWAFAGIKIYLEDIRAPYNVGAMFRTAESFGAQKIWLSPLCADPNHKRARRVAMGCVDVLDFRRFSSDPFAEKVENSESTEETEEFSKGPFFALETGGTPIEEFVFPKEGILVVGGEELGVSPLALAACDASLGRVSIKMTGAKGSLNVSVAFGIVMHAWALHAA